MMTKKILFHILSILMVWIGFNNIGYSQFLLKESFRDKTTNVDNNIVFGGNPVSYLTVNKNSNDLEGNGWLRLSNDSYEQKGYVYIDKAFPSKDGVFIDFEYKTWRTRDGKVTASKTYKGGDGLGFFLFDGSTSRFELGGYGGALGYAPMVNIPGLNGGYIGLGIDEYGNYNSDAGGKHILDSRLSGQSFPHSIGLRGETKRGANVPINESNKLLNFVKASQATHGNAFVSLDKIVRSRPTDAEFYRRVQVEIKRKDLPNNRIGSEIVVCWAITPGGKFYEILRHTYTIAPPPTLKLGFAASTGGAVNYHEIRDLVATTPDGVMVEKTVNKKIAKVDEELIYTIKVSNLSNVLYKDFSINDDLESLKPYFQVESIVFQNFGNIKNRTSLASNAKTINNVSMDLDANGTAIYLIKGKVRDVPVNGELINTVTLNIDNLPIENKEIERLKLTSTAKTQIIGSGILISNGNIYHRVK